MLMMLPEILLLLLLGGNSLTDLKEKKIRIWFNLLFLFPGFVLSFRTGRPLHALLAGFIPGAALLFISFLTKESIGYGDGIVVLACGSTADVRQITGFLALGLLLSFVMAAFLLMVRKGRKSEIPWIPYLFLGEVLRFLLSF